jgi:hypothetical protein
VLGAGTEVSACWSHLAPCWRSLAQPAAPPASLRAPLGFKRGRGGAAWLLLWAGFGLCHKPSGGSGGAWRQLAEGLTVPSLVAGVESLMVMSSSLSGCSTAGGVMTLGASEPCVGFEAPGGVRLVMKKLRSWWRCPTQELVLNYVEKTRA